MPTFGECQVCGELQILFGTVLEKTDGSGLRFVMCCGKCRKYFKRKGSKINEHDGLGQA